MTGLGQLARLYALLAPRRRLLLAGTVLLLALCVLSLLHVRPQEDVAAMLPSGTGRLADDLRLMNLSPLGKKVLITLHAEPETEPEALFDSADAVTAGLAPPLFTEVLAGPDTDRGMKETLGLLAALPNLFTASDADRVEELTTTKAIRLALQRDLSDLLSPQGLALKQVIQADPLGIRSLIPDKLAPLRPASGIHINEGRFVSEDGKNLLLMADTSVAVTDSAGALRLRQTLEALASTALLPGVTMTAISGHRYTLANSEAAKRDLGLVLTVSALCIALIFAVFIRSIRGLPALILPGAALCIAGVGTALLLGSISGITLGFGAVLMGISADFGLHVFYALRSAPDGPGPAMARVSRPILYGALTSFGAFGALGLSSLPGIRELALFSIIGLAAALVLALVVLPHLVVARSRATALPSPQPSPRYPARPWLWVVWAVFLLACLALGTKAGVNGDLRALGYVPPALAEEEALTRRLWGGPRDKAMVFSRGDSLDEALAKNELVYAEVTDNLGKDSLDMNGLVSLAPLLPSQATQEANRDRWTGYWQEGPARSARESIMVEGEALGFSKGAFDSFFSLLGSQPPPISLESLKALGLGGLSGLLLAKEDTSFLALTLAPDEPQLIDLFPPEKENQLGVRLVSGSRLRELLDQTLSKDFVLFAGASFAAMAVLLAVLFRNLRRTLLAMVPPLTGAAAVIGVLGLLGTGLNLFNVVSIPLILGLGADYGIFMVNDLSRPEKSNSRRAVLVSGLTTLAGFGGLSLASHPSLHAIGVTVLLGIGAALPAALLLLPRLHGGRV